MNNNEKRFLIKAVIIFIAVLLAVLVIHMLDKPVVSEWEFHAVAPGDTLWSIAREHNPHYAGDIRHITYEIKKANGMSKSNVYVGELIEVPVMG